MYRITLFFTNSVQGWSETLFRTNGFSNADRIFLEAYINRRLELLANNCSLISVRQSNVDTKRDITIFDLPIGGRRGAWAYGGNATSEDPGTETFTEDTFTALLLRLSDGNQNYRSFAMLGFPDHIFSANIILPNERALVTQRLNNWIGSMTAASLGGKFQSGVTASGKISVFAPKEPENQLVCLGLKGPIPAVGTLVTLGSVMGFPKLNRTWRVASTAAADANADGYIYLAGSAHLNTFGPVQGGTYKQSTFGVNVLNQYTISRLTTRKCGIPFDTVPGRR